MVIGRSMKGYIQERIHTVARYVVSYFLRLVL